MERGCKLHNNCFTCPFLDCKIGSPLLSAKISHRQEALRLLSEGKSFDEIAHHLGRSNRTVQRYVKRSYEYIKSHT